MFTAICLAVGFAASAIQWGWQPLPEGGHEYIVQVEPQLTDLETFRKEGFTSEIPPQLRDIRQIHIVVGSNPLPHQDEIPDAPAKLPGGVTANPLHSAPVGSAPIGSAPIISAPTASATPSIGERKVAASASPKSEKVTLTDGHEPTESPPSVTKTGNRSDQQTATATAKKSQPHPNAEAAPVGTMQTAAVPTPPRPWMTLLLVAAGLIVSLSGNVFLGWVHWGTRNQYRTVVSQLRQQRAASAKS